MCSCRRFVPLFILALGIAPVLAAEEPREKQRGQTDRARSAEEQQASVQAARATKLFGTEVVNRQDEELGEVENFIIRKGKMNRVEFAVVTSGGILGIGEDEYLVPFQALQLRGQEGDWQFVLDTGKDELKNAPKFDESEWEQQINDEAYQDKIYKHYSLTSPWKDEGEEKKSSLRDRERTRELGNRSRQGGKQFCLAGELIGKEVQNNQDKDLGDIEDLMIDMQTGEVAYAALSTGGILGFNEKLFAVPLQAFQEGQEEALVLDLEEKRLEQAPGFDSNDWPKTIEPDWLVTVCTFYKVEPADRQQRDRFARGQERQRQTSFDRGPQVTSREGVELPLEWQQGETYTYHVTFNKDWSAQKQRTRATSQEQDRSAQRDRSQEQDRSAQRDRSQEQDRSAQRDRERFSDGERQSRTSVGSSSQEETYNVELEVKEVSRNDDATIEVTVRPEGEGRQHRTFRTSIEREESSRKEQQEEKSKRETETGFEADAEAEVDADANEAEVEIDAGAGARERGQSARDRERSRTGRSSPGASQGKEMTFTLKVDKHGRIQEIMGLQGGKSASAGSSSSQGQKTAQSDRQQQQSGQQQSGQQQSQRTQLTSLGHGSKYAQMWHDEEHVRGLFQCIFGAGLHEQQLQPGKLYEAKQLMSQSGQGQQSQGQRSQGQRSQGQQSQGQQSQGQQSQGQQSQGMKQLPFSLDQIGLRYEGTSERGGEKLAQFAIVYQQGQSQSQRQGQSQRQRGFERQGQKSQRQDRERGFEVEAEADEDQVRIDVDEQDRRNRGQNRGQQARSEGQSQGEQIGFCTYNTEFGWLDRLNVRLPSSEQSGKSFTGFEHESSSSSESKEKEKGSQSSKSSRGQSSRSQSQTQTSFGGQFHSGLRVTIERQQ